MHTFRVNQFDNLTQLFLLHILGQEAKKVFDDAQKMLKKIIKDKSLKAHGVVAFYSANSVGDDIEVYGSNAEVLAVLHALRQQVKC